MDRTLVLLLLELALPGLVCGIEIFTPDVVTAINGTHVKLKCTFRSSHPVTDKSVTISWNFRPLNSGTDESVFYYQEVGYPPQSGLFKGHAVWSGDVLRSDASITLHDVLPTFNGTFVCQVRNRPDVHGSNGEITLKVVDEVFLSEMEMLAIGVGAAGAIMLLVLGTIMAVRFCGRSHSSDDLELQEREPEWKDPTVW